VTPGGPSPAHLDAVAFNAALAFTLAWEGGYVNDPDDPGGETKYGISKRQYPHMDIKNLTHQQAADIYRLDYWAEAGCRGMPMALAMCHFDAAVNHGVGRANGFLKMSKGRASDYLDVRGQFYHLLVARRPVMAKYLKGWMRRLDALRAAVSA